MLRFPLISSDGFTDRMYFFSDVDDIEPPPPSDVGVPDQFQQNVVRVFEQGIPEVFDFFVHGTPLAVYLAISDFPMPGAAEPALKELVELLLSLPRPVPIP